MKSVTLILVMVLFFMAPFLFAEDVKNAISETEFFEVFSGTWDGLTLIIQGCCTGNKKLFFPLSVSVSG